MSNEKLKYLSTEAVDSLRSDVRKNLARYRSGDFSDLMAAGDWCIELDLDVDLAPLASLDPGGSPEAEIANSKYVWNALHRIQPSVAYEEGIWVRLTHVECLQYARNRWLDGPYDDDRMERLITYHFFADTLTRRRDDNALSRLWWNGFIADLILPGTDLQVLDVVLRRADFRSNLIERSSTASRPSLAAAIVRAMQRHSWVTEREENFRMFMRAVNMAGGGIVFEAMAAADIDLFANECASRAGMPVSGPQP
jgi:hypothetical protein